MTCEGYTRSCIIDDMVLRKCKMCGKEFSVFPSAKGFYCSWQCLWKASAKRKHTKQELEKMRMTMLGKHRNEKNPMWKGKSVGYMGLHNWVRRHLGTPQRCDGKNCSGQSKRYHWANKSGKYKRTLKDWIRLCVRCHSKYDRRKRN